MLMRARGLSLLLAVTFAMGALLQSASAAGMPGGINGGRALRMSPPDEGQNAPIIAPPGADIAAIRRRLAEHDRQSRAFVLNKNEIMLYLAAQLQDLAGGATTQQFSATAVSTFNPAISENGNIFLAYSAQWVDYCVQGTLSGYCHAGIFDRARYFGLPSDKAIRTANKAVNSGPPDGAKHEDIRYWQNGYYQEIREMRVWNVSQALRDQAVLKARTYTGPYSAWALKFTNAAWYCSKIVWRAYFDTSGTDLDVDAGYWVTPGDIRWAPETVTVRVWSS